MPVTLVRPAAVPVATVRPLDRESLRITGTVVHVHLTGERPLVFFDDYSTWIGDDPSIIIPAGPGEPLDAENGDNLLTEAGDRMTTEYS